MHSAKLIHMFALRGYRPLDTCDNKKHADHESEERGHIMRVSRYLPSLRVPEGAAFEIPSAVLPSDPGMLLDGGGPRRTQQSVVYRLSREVPGGFNLVWNSTDVLRTGRVALAACGLDLWPCPPRSSVSVANYAAPHLRRHKDTRWLRYLQCSEIKNLKPRTTSYSQLTTLEVLFLSV